MTTIEPTTLVMKKFDIRVKALTERKSWTQQDFELKNVQLLNQIIEFINPLPRNLMLMSFHSMEHQREVMTSPIHALLINEPYYHQLIFPKVEKNTSQIIPYLTDKKSKFLASDWGILEPMEETSVRLNPTDIDVIFIPLLVCFWGVIKLSIRKVLDVSPCLSVALMSMTCQSRSLTW